MNDAEREQLREVLRELLPDLFAGLAMAGMHANPDTARLELSEIAREAYAQARSMMRAREDGR